jgi:hypothetical protein
MQFTNNTREAEGNIFTLLSSVLHTNQPTYARNIGKAYKAYGPDLKTVQLEIGEKAWSVPRMGETASQQKAVRNGQDCSCQ